MWLYESLSRAQMMPYVVFCFVAAVASPMTAEPLLRETFAVDPVRSERWKTETPGQVVWDTSTGTKGGGALRLELSDDPVVLRSQRLPIPPNAWVRGDALAKSSDATGGGTLSLIFYKGQKQLKEVVGGSPLGPLFYRPGPLVGTHDWTPMRVEEKAPAGADGVRVHLQAAAGSGTVTFDDVQLRTLERSELEGLLDREPRLVDPESLTPDDYVVRRGDDLYYQGQQLRIWSGQGNLGATPTHARMDWEVQQFLDAGFNCHRTLWWYNEVTSDYSPGDLSVQDRQDYLIALFGRHGSFIWLDKLNSCRIAPEDVDIVDDPETAEQWRRAVEEIVGDKGHEVIRRLYMVPWDERMQKIYHRYIRRVMAHRNPYNGLTYGEDPTIAIWELTNEEWWIARILWGTHLNYPKFFQQSLYAQWNDWLRSKYGTTSRLAAAWGGLLAEETLENDTVLLLPLQGAQDPNQMTEALGLDVSFEKLSYGPDDFSEQRGADVLAFLMDLHIQYKQDAEAVLREQGREGLGCQIVPVVFDTGYSGWILPFVMHAQGDAISPGVYIDASTHDVNHPTFPFVSGLKAPPSYHDWITNKRVEGFPTFIYELGIFKPQKYRVELPYRLLAMATMQDVDVVNWFYYGHPTPFYDLDNLYDYRQLEYITPQRNWDGVYLRMDEVLMSSLRVAGEAFRHGYLKSPENPVTVTVGRDFLYDFDHLAGGDLNAIVQRNAMLRGAQWRFDMDADAPRVDGPAVSAEQLQAHSAVRPTPQLSFDWNEGTMTIDDEAVKMLVGFLPERRAFDDSLALDEIQVQAPAGMPLHVENERYGAVGIVSTDGKPLDESARVLISLMSTSFNTGFAMDMDRRAEDATYAQGLARSITDPGQAPVQVARLGATIQANWLRGRHYKLIDFNRQIIGEGVIRSDRFSIDPEQAVFLVELTTEGRQADPER